MDEVYRYGSAHAVYPAYAYTLPPSQEVYYEMEGRRREEYEEAVIDWDRAYHFAGDILGGMEGELRPLAILPQPSSILEDGGDAARSGAVTFSRSA